MLGFDELDVSQLHELLHGDEQKVVLVDVRTPAEVARGTIAGARHIPLHLLPMAEHGLSKEGHTVFYCQTGARSAQACAFLAARGWKNIYNLRGGMMAWLHSGQTATALGAV